jgi:predicted permease
LWQDLKLALRMIRVRPGFTAVVVATLALGIGANTAIFSVVDAVLLRPLPYRAPQQLFFVWPTNPKDGDRDRVATLAEVELLRAGQGSFSGFAAVAPLWDEVILDGAGEAAAVESTYVSANLLEVLGVAPEQGRTFLPEEDVVGAPPVALLTHESWQRRFGRDPNVVGRTVMVGDTATRIVGVLPANVSFAGASPELWLPIARNASVRRWRHLTVVGRLRDGVPEGQARQELAAVAARMAAQFPEADAGVRLRMVGFREQLTTSVRPVLLLLVCAVALVLLIACANVANLTLARALARNGEMAVRVALGAGRGRLVRQLLTEGLVLGLLGAAAGVVLARWGVDLAMKLSPIAVPGSYRIEINGAVLALTGAIAVVTGVAFSLAPIWRLLRVEPRLAMRGGDRGATGGHQRLSRTLVIAEMALALMLLVGAALLTRTVGRLLAVDPGFVSKNVLTMQIYLPSRDALSRQRLYQRVEEDVRALPGVAAVGIVSRLPLATDRINLRQGLEIRGRPVDAAHRPEIDIRYASPDYFRAMGIPLTRGRLVTRTDPNLVAVNEVAARRFWPAGDPLGQTIRTVGSTGPPSDWYTVVGVVGSVRHMGLDVEPRPELYFQTDSWRSTQTVVVRTAAAPGPLVAPIRAAIQNLDSRLAISNVDTMEGVISHSMVHRRFGMLLLGLFAGVALLLAAVGLYGVMSFAVLERRREIGVRMALGAQEGEVARMVVRQGMTLVLVGAVIGLAGAMAVARLMASLLYGVTASDPLTLLAASTLLGLVALLACYLPARRATKLDPMIALR